MPEYTVHQGDTLSGIARRLHTTWQALFRRNRKVIGSNPNAIKAGERLAYGPLAGSPASKPAPKPAPVAAKPVVKVNPLVTKAVYRANHTYDCVEGECDHFTASYYGLTWSGYNSAYLNWLGVPAAHRHPGNTHPPAGAPVFWYGGPNHYGHAALSLGNGMIRCTDMDHNGNYVPGSVATIPLAWVSERWGLTYLGATDAWFQGRLITNVF